jgi:spermidine synthase
VVRDAIEHVALVAERHDVVMLDAFDPQGVAPTLCNRGFYADVRGCLDRHGVLVANLVGDKSERAAHLAMIRKGFGDNVLLLPLPDDGNHVVFAFRDPGFEPRWRWIAEQAGAMRARYGLDFPAFAAKLERSRKLGLARRGLDERPEVARRRLA